MKVKLQDINTIANERNALAQTKAQIDEILKSKINGGGIAVSTGGGSSRTQHNIAVIDATDITTLLAEFAGLCAKGVKQRDRQLRELGIAA